MNKFESKYLETAIRMDEAFLELLEIKDFSYITVKEICTKANVNRSTFYLHYDSLNDLLLECGEYITNRMSYYFDGIKNINNLEDISGIKTEELYFITPENLIPWLTSIKDNKRLFSTILSHGIAMGIDTSYGKLMKNIIHPILKRYNVAEEDIPYMMSYYIHGILAIVKIWLREDCKRDINDIVNLIVRCVAYDISQ